MSKNKTIKFKEFDAFSNTLDFNDDTKGKWHTIFGNTHPLVLELACGKGDYAIGLAALYPDKNFIGIDIKGNRLWKGAQTALEKGLNNVRFLRIQIDFIEKYFAENEVSEIWITFPDPQPHKPRKRLSSSVFLNRYRNIAVQDCAINIKTDSDLFFESSLETMLEEKLTMLEKVNNVYAHSENLDYLYIQTFYEKIWLREGRTIKYLKFLLHRK
jgi:tRNA (guanine-N7-)-methyltransferase